MNNIDKRIIHNSIQDNKHYLVRNLSFHDSCESRECNLITFKHIRVSNSCISILPLPNRNVSTKCAQKQSCLIETKADYICKQLELGWETNPVKMHHEIVHSMNSSSENIWFHSDTDTDEQNPHEAVKMNKFLNKPEMVSWLIFSNIVKYTQYHHLQTYINKTAQLKGKLLKSVQNLKKMNVC